MAGPGVRIGGAGGRRLGGAETRGDDLWQLFHMAISQPSTANERLFAERYRAMNPNSTLFGGGGSAGANVAQLNSAAAQLSGAASRLMAAAAQLTSAAGATRFGQMAASTGSAHLTRLVGERLDIPSAYAGGGGGGGRWRGGGGGWGRLPRGRFPASFPASSMLNFAMELGGAAPILGPILGFGAMAYEAMRTPIQIAHLERGFANEAMPYHNLASRTYALGRAGGFSGAGLTTRFYPGHFMTPPWMSALGVTPEDAANMLGEYGIVPRSGASAEALTRNLRTLSLSPAFAGMSQSSVIGMQRQMAGLGIGGKGTLDPFTVRLAGIMEQAVAKGMDRAQIMRSIQSGISRMAGGGSVSANAMADFFANTQGLGPGFRTGEGQLHAIGNLQSAMGHIGSNAPITTLAAAAIGRLRSPADFSRMFGGHALAEAEHNNPMVKLAERQIMEASRRGSPGLAFPAFRFLTSNPMLARGFARSAVSRMRGGKLNQNDLLTFDLMTGMGLDFQTAASVFATGKGAPAPSRTMNWYNGSPVGTTFTGTHDKDLESVAAAYGAPPQLAKAIETYAQEYGLDPRVLMSLAYSESHFKNTPHRNRNGTTDYGPFQINSATAKRYGIRDMKSLNSPWVSGAIAADYVRKHGIAGYNPGNPLETQQVTEAFHQLFPSYKGLPPTMNMVANAGQADLTAAYTSFKEFGEHLDTVNAVLVKTVDAFHDFDTTLDSVVKKFRAIMSPNQPHVPGT